MPNRPRPINAVVVLTDGRNEYTDTDLDGLLRELEQRPGERGPRVHHRVRPRRRPGHPQLISEASRAAAYDARNPATIDKVFADVLSNFYADRTTPSSDSNGHRWPASPPARCRR